MRRIASTMRLWEEDGPAKMRGTAVVDEKGAESVASYILARYFMYERVYQHRAIRSAESMLAMAFRRASSLPGGPAPAPRGGQARKSCSIWTTARATTRSGSGSQEGTASCAACRSGCSDGIPKAVAVADPAGTIANFAGSERGVERALARRRLSMHCRLVVDEQVAAGCRPYSAAGSDDKGAVIDHVVAAGRSGGLEETSRWSELVGAATRLAGEFRVFCPGSVAGEIRRILGGHAREQ